MLRDSGFFTRRTLFGGFVLTGVLLFSSTVVGEDLATAPDDEPIEFAEPRLVPAEPDGEEDVHNRGLGFTLNGHVMLWGDTFERPAGIGRSQGFYHQTRAYNAVYFNEFELVTEVDLLSGRLLGTGIQTPPEIANHGARPFEGALADPSQILDPRNLYAQWQSPVGLLRVGLQTSDWGLGLIANDGARDDDYFFGQSFGGDRVFRALFATAPLRPVDGPDWLDDLFVIVGADTVYRDDNADWRAGDRAYQFVGSLMWDDDTSSLGAYGAYRNQTDRDDSTLNVLALDIAGDHRWTSGNEAWQFRVAAEAVYLHGETTRADTDVVGQPLAVDAAGAAAHLNVKHIESSLGLQLRTGFASGDANPRGNSLHRFRFDPNYRAGLLLFDHHLPAWSQHSVDGAEDELRLRDTPRGIDNLVESGAITNTLYVHPVVLWDTFNDDLTLALGFLAAFTHKPIRDLLATFESGGELVGVAGSESPGRTMGWESQLGIRYRSVAIGEIELEYRAEAAFLIPGHAFDDAGGNRDTPTSLIRGFVTASW